MPITLHVSLLSGRTVPIETELDVDVALFKQRAQRALSVGRGRLVHPSGSVLNEAKALRDCELGSGNLLCLQVQAVTIRATTAFPCAAFAVVLGDGSVVTWGDAGCGGDSSAMQGQLRNVQQIQASGSAFAAILADGSVVTWANADSGGNSSAVQDQLKQSQ